MSKIVNTKDAGVELMRVLGCLIVIACHCVVQYKFDSRYSFPNTFIACLWADGVAIFWLIAGFFIFKGDNVAKKLKNFSIKRILPTLAVGMGLFYLDDWATSDISFSESIHHTSEEYLGLITGILKLQSPFPKSGHFWYVFIYVMILLALPALHGFYNWMVQKRKREITFMVTTFLALVVNDLFLNETFGFSNLSINAMVPACIFVIWGAILYRHKDIFIKPMMAIGGFLGFLCINVFRALTIVERNEAHELYWFTTFGLMAAICIFVFCINIGKIINNNIVGKIVCYIASFTFMVYLVHYGVKDTLTNLGVTEWVRSVSSPGEPLKVFGYTFLMMLATFIASFVLVLIMHYIKVEIVALWRKAMTSKKK